jgi:hypothetical protein
VPDAGLGFAGSFHPGDRGPAPAFPFHQDFVPSIPFVRDRDGSN